MKPNTLDDILSGAIPEPMSGCLLWMRCADRGGYGITSWAGQKWFAHRLIWFLAHGQIPASLEVCHSCDVTACIRLGHLYLGTHEANIADSVQKGRRASGMRNAAAKLTVASVLAIRSRETEEQRVLAVEYGVSQASIWNVLHRQTWAHV